MKALLTFSLIVLTTGCAANPTPNLTPLAPYSAVTDILVWLEDACEDPWEDAQTLTSIEAIADMFALPLTMVVYTVRLAAYMTVGVGMVLAGKDPKATVDQINWVFPYSLAGPNPDRVKYHQGMLKEESCLGPRVRSHDMHLPEKIRKYATKTVRPKSIVLHVANRPHRPPMRCTSKHSENWGHLCWQ